VCGEREQRLSCVLRGGEEGELGVERGTEGELCVDRRDRG